MSAKHLGIASAGMLFFLLPMLPVVRPAAANPAFAQAAVQPCSTCHQPGMETEAPRAGFTPIGQNIYNAFVMPGTSCSYNIATAIATQLSVSGAPLTPCYPTQTVAPTPNLGFTPTYPSQPSQPAPYRPASPNFTPTYPAQPSYPPQPAYPPQSAYPAQPAYPPPTYGGPPPWTLSQGKPMEFQSFCIFSGKSYFTVRVGGMNGQILHFTLNMPNKVRIELPVGSKWNSDCRNFPDNGGTWLTVF